MGDPKATCWIAGLFPCRLLHSCCQPGCSGKAWPERGTGWVFQPLELWSRYLLSVKFYIPAWDLSFALSQAAEGGCTATGCQKGKLQFQLSQAAAHQATWEAEVPVGRGSTVPEVNISAVLQAVPEVQPSAEGVEACRGQRRSSQCHSITPQPAPPLQHPSQHTETHSKHATLRLCLQRPEILWEPPSGKTHL